MTPKQADEIADELMEQRRQTHTDVKNIAARRVPWVYRVRGLDALEPWERSELVDRSMRRVDNQWTATLCTLLIVGLCFAAWWLLGLFDHSNVSSVYLVILCIAAAFVPRVYFIRREVRRRFQERGRNDN